MACVYEPNQKWSAKFKIHANNSLFKIMFIHLQKYLQAANDQIAASSITQGPPFCSPFCVLHTHFRPAPLSTWYGTELEQVPMCGTAERPAEITVSLLGGFLIQTASGTLSGRWTQIVWVTKRGTDMCQHSPAQMMNSALCSSAQHRHVWQETEQLFYNCIPIFDCVGKNVSNISTCPFIDELGKKLPSRGSF